jgi:hypothetical protein
MFGSKFLTRKLGIGKRYPQWTVKGGRDALCLEGLNFQDCWNWAQKVLSKLESTCYAVSVRKIQVEGAGQ